MDINSIKKILQTGRAKFNKYFGEEVQGHKDGRELQFVKFDFN